MARPSRTFQFPEINILTVAFSELVTETAPIELFEPVTYSKMVASPLPAQDPPTKTLPKPVSVIFV